jgi:hypothetical protein
MATMVYLQLEHYHIYIHQHVENVSKVTITYRQVHGMGNVEYSSRKGFPLNKD